MKTNLFAVIAMVLISGCANTNYSSNNSTVAEPARTPDQLNDLEIAHVAYTADLIDIQYAHLALGLSVAIMKQ